MEVGGYFMLNFVILSKANGKLIAKKSSFISVLLELLNWMSSIWFNITLIYKQLNITCIGHTLFIAEVIL